MANNEQKISRPIQELVESTQKNSTVGPLIGSIIVIVLIIGGGLYFFASAIQARKTQIQKQEIIEEYRKNSQIENIAKQSNSDSINDIETDIKSINIDELDTQIKPKINN